MAKLGTIKKVSIQSEWNMETEFSRWLAEEDNLNALATELGLEDNGLELKETEFQVGPYKADIVAQETSSERYVVIENQYSKTDHDHLGKLLTYSSSLNAGTIVWIAESFTEEHKKTLDWLNDNTTDELSFFGVQAELWKIDDSRPAIRFNVVSSPNTIVKGIKTRKPLNSTQQLQLEFWELVRQTLLKEGILTSAQKAGPQHWYNVALGKSNIFLVNAISILKGWLRIQVYIRGEDAEKYYEKLFEQKAKIEDALGQLIWNSNQDKKTKTIGIPEHSVDFQDQERWQEYANWMADQIGNFRRVFMPLLKKL